MENKEKFERLFINSKVKLLNVAYSVVRNKDDAEDVLQDAYVKAWKKFDEFDQNKKFFNWMSTIVRNAGIDYNRNKIRQKSNISIDSSKASYDNNSNFTFNLEDKRANLQDNYEKEEIYSVIQGFPDELRIVMIPLIQGFSYSEISESTDVSLSTVRARVHRAKQILRKNPKLATFANV